MWKKYMKIWPCQIGLTSCCPKKKIKDDLRWESQNHLWLDNDKVWRQLLPYNNLWCIMPYQGIWAKQRNNKIYTTQICDWSLAWRQSQNMQPINYLLRSVQQSVTYMNFETYMTAVKVFISFHNMQGIEVNKNRS